MHCFTRAAYILRIEFHSRKIRRYRREGLELMRRTGELVSPRLVELNCLIVRHGCILHRLERAFEQQT